MHCRTLHAFAIATAITVVAAGCQPGNQTDVAEVRQAIEQVDMQWEQAFNGGNAAGVANLYAEDGRLLAPGSEMVQGRENIQAMIQGFIDAGLRNIDFTSVEVGASGDLAYEIGRYTYEVEVPGAPQRITDSGKYIIVVREDADGSWKIVADIFNTSQPAPAAQQ